MKNAEIIIAGNCNFLGVYFLRFEELHFYEIHFVLFCEIRRIANDIQIQFETKNLKETG